MKNNSRLKALSQHLSMQILWRMIIEIAVFFPLVFAVWYTGLFIGKNIVWQGDELFYAFFHFLYDYRMVILPFICLLGSSVIFACNLRTVFGYLEKVVDATARIYDPKPDLIELPLQLREVENQMNQVKLQVRESQRLAKEAEQRKNDLVVYLAHDLKTPLTSVIGYLSLLRDESQISEELREKYLSISLEKAQRLEDLINEFFEITRFNLSTLTLAYSRVNLTRLLEQLLYEFQPMLSPKNLQCTLRAEPDKTIKCDVDKMQRVFDNLLRNAVNYSFENSTIAITVAQEEQTLHISFVNHGNTIPKEKLDRIFEQFYRLDTARTTKSGGAGLGLAIAKEIAELHHGSITAHSEDDMIAFEVCIPQL